MFFWYIHENIISQEWKKYSKLENDKEEQNMFLEKKNIIDLEELILKYDKNRELFRKWEVTEKEAMEIRSQFIQIFHLIKSLI